MTSIFLRTTCHWTPTPELGNNAQLGRVLGLQASSRFGEQDLGFAGALADGGSLTTPRRWRNTCRLL